MCSLPVAAASKTDCTAYVIRGVMDQHATDSHECLKNRQTAGATKAKEYASVRESVHFPRSIVSFRTPINNKESRTAVGSSRSIRLAWRARDTKINGRGRGIVPSVGSRLAK